MACATLGSGGAWSVSVRGGEVARFVMPGARVAITGVHRVTGDRFAVPIALECANNGGTLRFEVPCDSPFRPRWALAG